MNMDNFSIGSIYIKPGQVVDFNSNIQPMNGENGFVVTNSDNAVLLRIYAPEEANVTVYAGDGPLAGNDLHLNMEASSEVLIWLESGRYMSHTADGTNVIRLHSDVDDTEAYVIELV